MENEIKKLKEMNKKLRKENKELLESLGQINKLVNAIHIAVILQCSETGEVRVPVFDVGKINNEYKLSTVKDEEKGEYVMRVTKNK